MDTPIRYRISEVDYGDAELQAVADVVRSKWISLGPKTAEFESRFAERLEVDHAVAVSSGTAALHLSLLACGIGPGDEVLVPSYTFVASVNPITLVGATPVFADIVGPDDLNVDPTELERKVTAKTKAMIVVHMAGFPADMDRICAIARHHGLAVIEDACHAVGARYAGDPDADVDGRMVGTAGTVGCFSFFANKNLATGEGGMAVTSDPKIAERIRLARSHGMTKTSWDKAAGRATDYDVKHAGLNYRCTEFTSALGLVQLEKLQTGNDRRRELVARYRQRLAGCESISIPFADRLDDSSHHIFPILLADPRLRDKFRQELLACGIQTTHHYPAVHKFAHYEWLSSEPTSLPRTEDASEREVTLPLYPLLEEHDVDIICDSLLQLF